MRTSTPTIVQELTRRGVVIRQPASVDVDSSIRADRIAPGVILHAGCRLKGKETSIGPGCVLGEEGPVTIDNCQLGSDVALKGGFFSGSVFLSGASCGSCAHVRPATLFEEQASCAHSVGLKQTLLMPYVTLGSLINFCDVLMAGGMDRKHHSEVGSSYIHFNFTAHGDKATASLVGDVPRGVMLDQPPIFLGGQGGLVGPTRLEYGTIIAAGTICRRDVTKPGRLVFGETGRTVREYPYEGGAYGDVSRILANNLAYLGNLHALLQWYTDVRPLFLQGSTFDAACCRGAQSALRRMIGERVSRITDLSERMAKSIALAEKRSSKAAAEGPYALQKNLHQRWPKVADKFESTPAGAMRLKDRDALLAAFDKRTKGAPYPEAIKALSASAKTSGTAWLQSIVDSVVKLW